MYERFLRWLFPEDGGAPSIARTARQLGLSKTTLAEQAERYRWRERRTEYERNLIEAEAHQQNQLARKAGRDSLQLLHRLRDELVRLIDEMSESEDVAVRFQCALDVSKVLDRVIRNERLILGLSTSHESITVSDGKPKRKLMQDLRHLTDEQLGLSQATAALELVANNDPAELRKGRQELAADFALLAHFEALLRWLPPPFTGRLTHAEYKRRWAEVYGAEGEQP